MTVLYILIALLIVYVGLVRWRMAQPRKFVYNSWMAWWLIRLCKGMVCTTLWHTAYEYKPEGTPGWTLLPAGKVHERTHMDQWDRHPYLFPVLYACAMIRDGYKCNRYEIAARKAAGEPLECPDQTAA